MEDASTDGSLLVKGVPVMVDYLPPVGVPSVGVLIVPLAVGVNPVPSDLTLNLVDKLYVTNLKRASRIVTDEEQGVTLLQDFGIHDVPFLDNHRD